MERTLIKTLEPQPEGYLSAPWTPEEKHWDGLPRDIMMWLDMDSKPTAGSLFQHLKRCGSEIPEWLLAEPELQSLGSVPSKGTRVVILYKAVLHNVMKGRAVTTLRLASKEIGGYPDGYNHRAGEVQNIDAKGFHDALLGVFTPFECASALNASDGNMQEAAAALIGAHKGSPSATPQEHEVREAKIVQLAEATKKPEIQCHVALSQCRWNTELATRKVTGADLLNRK